MAGLWDTGTKKQTESTVYGGGSKSIYETYGGKEEEDDEERRAKVREEEKKRQKTEQKKKSEDKPWYADLGDFGKDLALGIAGTAQRAAGTVAQAGVGVVGAIDVAQSALSGNMAEAQKENKKYMKTIEDIQNAKTVDNGSYSFISQKAREGKASVGQFGAEFAKAGADTSGFVAPAAKGASLFSTVGKTAAIEGGVGFGTDVADQFARTGKVDVGQAAQAGATNAVLGGVMSGVGSKIKNRGVEKELAEKTATDRFTTFADGATAKGESLKKYTEDIDRRLTEVDSPEYQKNNGLTRVDEAKAKYEEIMAEPGKLPEVQAATRAVIEADETLKQYEVMRQDSPFNRRADSIQNKIDNVEAAREKDLEQLETMANDPIDELPPEAFPQLQEQVNAKYDEILAQENARMEALMVKSPQEAQENQVLKQTMEQVAATKQSAQEGLDGIMAKTEENARKESEKLASEPNEEAIAAHKEFLETKKTQLENRLEKAKQRYEAENKSVEHVDEEIIALKEGSHPLSVEGAKDKMFTRFKELTQERAKMKAYSIAETDPKIPKTEVEQATIMEQAINEVGETKIGMGAKILKSFQQPAGALRNAGYEKLADMRTDGVIAYNKMAYDNKMLIQSWTKQAKHNSSQDMFDAANGDAKAMEKLTPGAAKTVEEWQSLRKQLGEKMGLPKDLLERDFYIPHLFTSTANQPKLIEIQSKIKRAQDEIDAGTLDESALKAKETHMKKLYDEIKGLVDVDKVETYTDFVKDKGDYSNRFLKKREGAEGYEKNFYKAVEAYMGAANTKINVEPVMQAMAKSRNLLENPEKGMGKYLQNEIDKLRGTKAGWDQAWDDGFKNLVEAVSGDRLSPQRGATTALKGFRTAMSLSHIGFSVNSAVNTMAQVAFLPGSVNADGAIYGMMQATNLSRKLAQNTLFPADIEDFKQMQRMGAFEGSSNLLPDVSINKYSHAAKQGAGHFTKAAFAGITGADRYIRMSTYYGAKLKAEQQGLSGQAAERYIYERINEVNQNFSKLETPHAFRSQVAKTMGSMITFLPGVIIRSGEIGAKTIKGGSNVVGYIGRGKDNPVTKAEFLKDVDSISKGLFTAMSVYGVGQAIGAVTGQDEVIPNPLNGSMYSSPALQFVFGNDSKSGLKGMLTSQMGDEYDEDGNNVTQKERFSQFWTEVIPAFTIPGWSQGKRTSDALGVNEKGYSETATGRIRYKANEDFNAQRAVFGQYSTPEGKEYIDNMGKPGGGSISPTNSEMIKEAPEDMQQQYYDFFRNADRVTGRSEVSKKVTELFQNGEPEKARRTAEEFNAKVDTKMADFYSKYQYIDPDLEDKMNDSLYITLTDRSEASRSREDE